MKIIIAIMCAAILSGCSESKLYIITDGGLTHHWRASCVAGMLISNDGLNIVNTDSVPITCNGYIKLTDTQHDDYLNDR